MLHAVCNCVEDKHDNQTERQVKSKLILKCFRFHSGWSTSDTLITINNKLLWVHSENNLHI